MAIKYLDGMRIYYGFAAGADEVQKNKRQLNKTNVFPVPDGDTGNNLHATFSTIAQQTKPTKNVYSMMSAIADASLMGARGNSGIIVAQFLNGWSEAIAKRETLSTAEFGETLFGAVPHAYQSISQPVEGTILTVIRVWAEAVQQLGRETEDFVELLVASLAIAKEALANTPNQLEILKKSEVVDAGAQGFVNFLEGIVNFIREGSITQISKNTYEEWQTEALEAEVSDLELTYRYCTEALVVGQQMDREAIRQQLADLGDSVIIAGTSEKVRVHLHTNQPDEVMSRLQKSGQIEQQKVDNMSMQYQMRHQRKQEIALMTDSIADLPMEYLEAQQIHLLPLNLLIDGSTYLDKVTITPEFFYQWIDQVKEYPSSSQPSVKVIEQRLEELAKYYSSIIIITVAKPLSGTWNAVRQVAEKISKIHGIEITVIDSKLNSGAQGLLVMEAARSIAERKAHQEVVESILETIPKTKIYVSVDTFKYMVRNGRVSPVKGLIGKLFNIKPIVSLDEEGKGTAFGTSLSRSKNRKKIIRIVKDAHKQKNIKHYSIVHASAPHIAKIYEQELIVELGFAPAYTVEISPIVGLSAGKGAVAVSFVTES